jgi:hypothetical protein
VLFTLELETYIAKDPSPASATTQPEHPRRPRGEYRHRRWGSEDNGPAGPGPDQAGKRAGWRILLLHMWG